MKYLVTCAGVMLMFSLSGCYVTPAYAPPPPPPVAYAAPAPYYPAGYYAAPAPVYYGGPVVGIGFGGGYWHRR